MPTVKKCHFNAGCNVAHNFQPSTEVSVVASGVLKVFDVTASGDQLIRKFVFPGEFIELRLMNTSPRSNVVALTDARICKINLRGDEQDIVIGPEITGVLLEAAFNEVHNAYVLQELLSLRRPIDRVIRFLVDVIDRSVGPKVGHCVAALPMSREDIADYLFLQRETVSRCFSQLHRAGFLQMPDRHTGVIKDMEHFRELLDIDNEDASNFTKSTQTPA